MNSLTEENYLKAIFHLNSDENTVTINELSKFLNIKMPSVNNMMKKFDAKNWVIYEKYMPLKITEKGLKEASLVVRKHRLTEMFLVEKMGFGWEEVHEIAEQIEHIKSQIFFEKIDELLDYPKTDPHGSPIPDKNGKIIENQYHKLSECKPGQKVIFSALTESPNDFLKYLNQKKLSLNTEISILETEPFDKSMKVKYLGREEILSQMVCEKLLVEKA
ncbi:metal-dependent transcriptional regulator [uncultured Chryseobacterium sp.]|uniref:metal-dependent transcriptional regulator n=1 Tax=uncultured Chryseobacterium sp. TaxID=259322 RepID=UPI00262F513D|nr:metal-dependent transcriptional regulator [uncultured Chryseobacterium sp.]